MYKVEDCSFEKISKKYDPPTKIYLCPFGNLIYQLIKPDYKPDYEFNFLDAVESIKSMPIEHTAKIIMNDFTSAADFRRKFLDVHEKCDYELMVAEFPMDYQSPSHVVIKKLQKGFYYNKYITMLKHVISSIPENNTHAIEVTNIEALKIIFYFLDKVIADLKVPIQVHGYPYNNKSFGLICLTKSEIKTVKTFSDMAQVKSEKLSQNTLTSINVGDSINTSGKPASIRAMVSMIGKKHNMKFSVSDKGNHVSITRIA